MEEEAIALSEALPKCTRGAPFMKERRKAKNRITAKLSRERRAVYVREIEHSLQLAQARIAELETAVAIKEKRIAELEKDLALVSNLSHDGCTFADEMLLLDS